MIENLTLKDFRSYSSAKFSFSKKTNIILGKNGAGKTNILEAILILCTGKSYRAQDDDLISYNKQNSQIKGVFDKKERLLTISNKEKKQFKIQNKVVKKLQFSQTLPVVLFEPDFMQITSRGPDARRDYFDQLIARISHNYQQATSRYKRTLTQRNKLLKNKNFSKEEMFVWNIKLSELAGFIVEQRSRLLDKINESSNDIYSELADKKQTLRIEYISKIGIENYANNLIKGLEKNLEIDKELGFTTLGPHRDDFDFFINKKQVQTSASRGETRTVLLTLKIIESKLVEKAREEKPILLLDDVFSELDETRQAKLVEFFYDKQVIITTTNITPLLNGVEGKIIEIS